MTRLQYGGHSEARDPWFVSCALLVLQIGVWAVGGSLEGVADMIDTTVAFVAVSSGRVGFSTWRMLMSISSTSVPISTASVKTHMRRGRARLAAVLGEQDEEGVRSGQSEPMARFQQGRVMCATRAGPIRTMDAALSYPSGRNAPSWSRKSFGMELMGDVDDEDEDASVKCA